MIKLSKSNHKRQLGIHGWVGLLSSFLLYIVVFTGAVVVFEDELEQWSTSGIQTTHPFEYSIYDTVNRLAQKKSSKGFWDDIDVRRDQGNLIVFFHTHKRSSRGFSEPFGVRYVVNPKTQEILEQQQGFLRLMKRPQSSLWVYFMRHMHTNLYIPGRLGLYLTGILGLLLLVLAVSGFLLHRHIIKDMFLSPRKANKTQKVRDGHGLTATWALPYAFVLAFSGAFLSFALSLSLPVIAYTAFKGNINNATQALVNEPKLKDLKKADDKQLFDLDELIQLSKAKANSLPDEIVVIGYGKKRTFVSVTHYANHIDNNFSGYQFLFNGNTGKFIREVAIVGKEPSVSSHTVNLMFALHFGNFSGRLSKLLWFALGLLLCYVIVTGFRLWFERRIKDSSQKSSNQKSSNQKNGSQKNTWQSLYPSVPIMTYGVPVSFICAGIGFFLSYSGAIAWQTSFSIWFGFAVGWSLSLFGLASSTVISLMKKTSIDTVIKTSTELKNPPKKSVNNSPLSASNSYILQYLRCLMAIVSLCLVCMRWLASDSHWLELYSSGNYMVIFIDAFFIVTAMLMFDKFFDKKASSKVLTTIKRYWASLFTIFTNTKSTNIKS